MLSRRNRIAALALPPLAALLLAGSFWGDYRYKQDRLRTRAEALTGGDTERGQRAFLAYGCGGCHSMRGVPRARGLVGPPLDGIASRSIIAGRLQNTPGNLMRWIADPQAVAPGTAMPRLGVTRADQRDLAAFLYTRP
jgi:cytochrome c2